MGRLRGSNDLNRVSARCVIYVLLYFFALRKRRASTEEFGTLYFEWKKLNPISKLRFFFWPQRRFHCVCVFVFTEIGFATAWTEVWYFVLVEQPVYRLSCRSYCTGRRCLWSLLYVALRCYAVNYHSSTTIVRVLALVLPGGCKVKNASKHRSRMWMFKKNISRNTHRFAKPLEYDSDTYGSIYTLRSHFNTPPLLIEAFLCGATAYFPPNYLCGSYSSWGCRLRLLLYFFDCILLL